MICNLLSTLYVRQFIFLITIQNSRETDKFLVCQVRLSEKVFISRSWFCWTYSVVISFGLSVKLLVGSLSILDYVFFLKNLFFLSRKYCKPGTLIALLCLRPGEQFRFKRQTYFRPKVDVKNRNRIIQRSPFLLKRDKKNY